MHELGVVFQIADSLASGKCFLLFAPETVESYKYLEENQLAYTVNSPKKLQKTLQLLSSIQKAREKYTENALKAVELNHSLEKNRKYFINIISKTVGETDEGSSD